MPSKSTTLGASTEKLYGCDCLTLCERSTLQSDEPDKLRRKHRKKTELMLEMISLLNEHARGKTLHFLGDSAYTGARMLEAIPDPVQVTGRIGKDARLCEAPPQRTFQDSKGHRGLGQPENRVANAVR